MADFHSSSESDQWRMINAECFKYRDGNMCVVKYSDCVVRFTYRRPGMGMVVDSSAILGDEEEQVARMIREEGIRQGWKERDLHTQACQLVRFGVDEQEGCNVFVDLHDHGGGAVVIARQVLPIVARRCRDVATLIVRDLLTFAGTKPLKGDEVVAALKVLF